MEMKELMARGKSLLKAKDPACKACFEEAIENGNIKANYQLATVYRFGIGVEANIEKAVELYKKAAKAHSNPALYQLGKLSEVGRGIKKSREEARKYYIEAAEAGYPKAQYELAKMLEADYDKAKHREENENKRAQKIINENRKPVKAIKENAEEVVVEYIVESTISNAEAVSWYEKYIEATQDEEATLHLAWIYEIGKGITKNEEAAMELYKKLADNGSKKNMLKLAKTYQIKGNIEEAASWYTKLYQAGDKKAAYTLGLMYEEANMQEQAVEWYTVAAEEGSYDAKHKLNNDKIKPVTTIVGQEFTNTRSFNKNNQ